MKMMAPTRPAELHACRLHLTTGPATAAEARSQTPAGKATYFTLALQPGLAKGGGRGPG